jgi:hypothetical protein
MTALKTVVVCLALVLLAAPARSFADDLVLDYSLLDGQSIANLWKGTVKVEVRNLSRGDVRNVDLRLAMPSVDQIEKSLLQLGGIPSGQSRTGSAGLILDAGSSAPLLWKVDYDDAAGAHRQTVLRGILVGQ